MATSEPADNARYKVVINHEEQYSIWPEHRDPPAGWREVGTSGTREECLSHIEQVWTDMRPLSLRQQMDAQQGPQEGEPGTSAP
jgi:MbtH protein